MTNIAAKLKGGEINRRTPNLTGRERLNVPNDEWYSADEVPDCESPPIVVGTKILVRPAPRIKKIGNIELPDSVIDDQVYQNAHGRVIQIGPLCWTDWGDGKPWCKEGDWITFGRYAGVPITYDGVRMVIINDEEVIAILPDWKKFQVNS